MEVPQSYKALQLSADGQLFVGELPIPEILPNQVLVKVAAAPINPSDLIYMSGGYGQLKYPATVGNEGSGVIVRKGDDVKNYTVSQRVSFHCSTTHKTYSEYSVINEDRLIALANDVTFEQGSSSFINPVTVIGMLDVVKEHKATAVVQNASASALGRQLIRYFRSNNIQVINIVRRQEQEELLREKEGAQYVLNETSPDFKQELHKLSKELNATILFDPVGGEVTGNLLSLLPPTSIAYVYGLLSGQAVSNVSIQDLLIFKKQVRGFMLNHYLEKYPGILQKEEFQTELNKQLISDLRTDIAQTFSLEQFKEAFESYKQNPTKGKVLIVNKL